jgi:Phage protein (N4 Gp49/phage Sf6 gene 66) family
MSDSLQVTDQASEAVAVAPRVKLADIEDAIVSETYFTGDAVAACINRPGSPTASLATLTICLVVMRNGFVVVGKAAPASPENFDPDLGRRFAYEDAIRQLWPLMGYALRDKLAGF